MKQPMRLKSGGFISSGTDAGDLKILRTAKNIDDGSANGMRRGGRVKRMNKGGKSDTMGASPAEIRAVKSKRISDSLKKVNRPTNKRLDINPGTKVKGERERDLARLAKIKKEAAEFEKTLEKKKRSQTSKMDYGVVATPRLGAMTGRRGKSLVKGDITKKMKAGGKTKSRVNEAGNYTKPGLRKRIFNRIKAGGKGGRPGQWSARKAQMMAKAYKKAGGGYK